MVERSRSVKRVNSNSLSDYYILSKKPRYSHSREESRSQTIEIGSSSTVSRVSLYPERSIDNKWKREVHAPRRTLRFGQLKHRSEEESSADRMGNFFVRTFHLARKKALEALRYVSTPNCAPQIVYTNEDKYGQLDKLEKGETCGESGEEQIEMIEDVSDAYGEDDVKIVEERSVVTLSEDVGHGSVEETEDKLRLHCVNQTAKLYDTRVEPYKRMANSASRRNERLDELNFDIKLNEKKLGAIRERKPSKGIIQEVPADCFVSLTCEEKAEIQRAFSINRKKVLVSHQSTNIDITSEVLQCLKPKAWLNDEVINVYLELLKERERREPLKFNKCHFFNTFFYKKLMSDGFNYRAVKRWTTEKKLGYFLIDCEKIFVPIHREIHWCLAIIHNKDKKLQYLDSLGGQDLSVLENLAKYFVEEVKDKCRKDIDISGWKRECPHDLPEQENGYDCGMFMIKYADFCSRGLGFCFSQEDMAYFRLRTAKEILRLRAE